LATIISLVGSPGTVGPANGGKVTASNPGTSGSLVLAANTARQSVIFANPGPSNVWVFPMLNATGGVNAPTAVNPAGDFLVMSGALLTVSGECQGAWGAFGASASNDLTIMETNV
jgi:hypothetical protein